MNEDVQKEFLKNFPKEKHSLVMNQFCSAYRDGARAIDELIVWVKFDAIRRIECARNGVDLQTQSDLLRLLKAGKATLMAEYVIWWEELPWEEKDKIKRERGESYKAAYMASAPPTEKQLAYLKGLKCPTIPTSRLEASQLIEQWKK